MGLIDYAGMTEDQGGTCGPDLGSAEIEGVSHDARWHSTQESIREPSRFCPCSDVSSKECTGFVQRTLTASVENYGEDLLREPSGEIASTWVPWVPRLLRVC